jgi:phenol 2-monooxygenase
MNVSMMDSYNLAWKLAHSLHGLTPLRAEGTPDPVLETFEQERSNTARQLIEFDKRFSHMFSGKIGAAAELSTTQGLSHDDFLRVFSEGSGFTSGCGLHYGPSAVVMEPEVPLQMEPTGDPNTTHLTIGKRLLNVTLKRFADGSVRQLHDGVLLDSPHPFLHN